LVFKKTSAPFGAFCIQGYTYSMKISKNFPAIIAVLIPVIFIAILLFAVYLPSYFSGPHKSFAYSISKTNYNYQYIPPAVPGTIVDPPQPKVSITYHIYDAKSRQNRTISETDFKGLNIEQENGFNETVDTDYSSYSSDPFMDLFGSSYRPAVYLQTSRSRKKLFNLNYEDQFAFAGWLK
jgi:hypothetical protein